MLVHWVKVIWAKDGDFWTTQGGEINFFRQNTGMFERLCTQTNVSCQKGKCNVESFIIGLSSIWGFSNPCQHGLQMSFLGPVYIGSAVNTIETPFWSQVVF